MEAEKESNPIRVLELFAGVGGFKFSLEKVNKYYNTPVFHTVWSNQFEPGAVKQHAAKVFVERWGSAGFANRDINDVLNDSVEMADIEALKPTMLVGGFPCQDYSVAKPLNQSAGLEGKKGVLWWMIHQLLKALQDKNQPIKYVLLENVDRLLASPSTCPGRDFAVILSSLQSLGYGVEWRVINAADYGYPQKRKRIFILAYHCSTEIFKQLASDVSATQGCHWMTTSGVFAEAFPVQLEEDGVTGFPLTSDVFECQNSYVTNRKGKTRFGRGGICINNMVYTANVETVELSDYSRYVGQAKKMTLDDVVSKTLAVPATFYIDETSLPRWAYLKGSKTLLRTSGDGRVKHYSEGKIPFPDPVDRPARTIITSEGGTSASRTKHVIRDKDGRLRRLTPEELEALNGFPRGFTKTDGVSDNKRAFLMGNALVTGIVTATCNALYKKSCLGD